MDSEINEILNMEEVATLLQRAEVIMKTDLGGFCVNLLEFICPSSNEYCRAYLINDITGQNLLLKLEK